MRAPSQRDKPDWNSCYLLRTLNHNRLIRTVDRKGALPAGVGCQTIFFCDRNRAPRRVVRLRTRTFSETRLGASALTDPHQAFLLLCRQVTARNTSTGTGAD
jgi:hypothetical protein